MSGGTARAWPPHQLTTWELAGRRADLEGRLGHLPAASPRAKVLGAELAAVIAEQDERDRAARDSTASGEQEARLRAVFGNRLDGL